MKQQALDLTLQLRLDNKQYVDPSMKNPRTNRPVSNSANRLYEHGKEVVNKSRGWESEKRVMQIQGNGKKKRTSTNKGGFGSWIKKFF